MSNEKFKNKYRITSARTRWWDYGWDGYYFITICTAYRECLLGDIVDGEMQLSAIGEIVNREWGKSFEIRKELFCDIFVIMPNHIHAILRIDNNVGSHGQINNNVGSHGQINNNVETHGRASLLPSPSPFPFPSPPSPFPPSPFPFPSPPSPPPYRSPKSISSFVAGFKSSTTKLINELRNTPKSAVWQSRFHDHIIRNNNEYWRIAHYIANNPLKWADDTFCLD
jgi:REP element-mobilizing transposase RayT